MSKKLIAMLVVALAIIVVSLLPIFPVTRSAQVPEQVPYSVCEDVPYQVEEKREVPVDYDLIEHYVHSVGLFDWELEYVCTIENVDEKGGTFTVTAKFYDGDRLVYTASDRKYIGPGETATFKLKSSGLSYSTDWKSRYSVYPDIEPPKKIETHIATKYKRECRTEYKTEYKTVYWTEHVNLIQLLLGKK